MKHKVNFQMTLSLPQLTWLADSKYGKNRMSFLVSMLRMTALAGYRSVVNNIPATVHVGQLERSEVQLAKDWKCDRKTVARVIWTMNKLGIITTRKSNRTSVHDIHIVAAWVVDNVRIRNPNFKTSYDWHDLRQGCLTNAVPDAAFGLSQERNERSGKLNVPSGLSHDEAGKPAVLPTVEGLEELEALAEEPASTDGGTAAADGETQAPVNVEPEAKQQPE